MTISWNNLKDRVLHSSKEKCNNFIHSLFYYSNENIFQNEADCFKLGILKKWLLFNVFLVLMILDRVITLIHFGFVYTDVDQVMMWNGALDYSKGIFHEPFFYGQNYNYMFEAIFAVPLLWLNIPIYIALPVSTSLISILPFIILALFFMKRESYFWAFLSLAFPVLLPIQYNFLTTISRGFVQAHFFVPLLFIPLFNPQSKISVTILYISSAICFIANQSSILIIAPIALLVCTYHFKSLSLYLKSLLVIPFYIADHFAKQFYIIHPESLLRKMSGLEINSQTLLTSVKDANLFENLFPFFSNWGITYPFLFIFLAIIALIKSRKKEFIFVISALIILLISLAVPKVQEPYPLPDAGIFFSLSRFYLFLPVLLIITLYLIFRKLIRKVHSVYFLLILCGIIFLTKNYRIHTTVHETVSQTRFPVANNKDLVTRADEVKHIADKYNIDLIVYTMSDGWNYYFDSYAYYPLTSTYDQKSKKTISVCVTDDRRSWLYPNSKNCKHILFNGIQIDKSLLKEFDYEIINQNQIVVKNNKLNVSELCAKLNIKFGNAIL